MVGRCLHKGVWDMLKKLTSPYWVFAFALLTKAAPAALERWLSSQDWWRGLPFDWLAITFLAVGVGVVWCGKTCATLTQTCVKSGEIGGGCSM